MSDPLSLYTSYSPPPALCCSYLLLFLPFLADFVCLCTLILLERFLVEAFQARQQDQDLQPVIGFVGAWIVQQHQRLQHGEHLQFCHFLEGADPIVPEEKGAQCVVEMYVSRKVSSEQ